MPSWQARYFTVCGAVIGYCIAYVLCDFGEWRRLTYYPLERSWRLVSNPGAVPSNYVGTVLWGLGGAVVGAAVVLAATKLAKRELSRRWVHLAGAWALTAFAYAGLYYTWGLWPF